jgi:hypothetical protein
MCLRCKGLAVANWVAGHPAVAVALALTAVLLVGVPIWVVRR